MIRICALLLLALATCSGPGPTDGATAPDGVSRWDEMHWDEDPWQ